MRKKLLKKSNISNKKIETIETNDKINENKDKNELIYNDIKFIETQKRKKNIVIFCAFLGIFDFLKDLSEIIINKILKIIKVFQMNKILVFIHLVLLLYLI